jgi:hypothetical protein
MLKDSDFDGVDIPDFTPEENNNEKNNQPNATINNLNGSWRSYDGHYISVMQITKDTYRTFHSDFNKTVYDLTLKDKYFIPSYNKNLKVTLDNNVLDFGVNDKTKRVQWFFIDHTLPKPIDISGIYQHSDDTKWTVDVIITGKFTFTAYHSRGNHMQKVYACNNTIYTEPNRGVYFNNKVIWDDNSNNMVKNSKCQKFGHIRRMAKLRWTSYIYN